MGLLARLKAIRERKEHGELKPANGLKAPGAHRSMRQQEGDAAEDRALRYLEAQGLRLLERNFLCKGGEIDLIMQSGQVLVFVEVRKRGSGEYGGAAASITPRKQARILLAAQIYLQRYPEPPACRVDVVTVDGLQLRWLRNAIEAA